MGQNVNLLIIPHGPLIRVTLEKSKTDSECREIHCIYQWIYQHMLKPLYSGSTVIICFLLEVICSNSLYLSHWKWRLFQDQTYPISSSLLIKVRHFEVHITELCLLQMSALRFDLVGHFRRSSQSPEGYLSTSQPFVSKSTTQTEIASLIKAWVNNRTAISATNQ